ncbi:TetR/AcrR family transcriptional regulator [Streptomyces sp. ISL-100]|uniref:TetR/AcrR family transcriptional regulator n=1 Tax=Streptomyces sp. ISL-100 TaxID=2819173 RepID=UPI001BED3175|nr:TetR/AcrR family transcriptional regulator [Streptomyces sp. ISL-100]MBT2398449.1 TetR/AcrR family transcriptional regulator [Streptomyces sp. ISL-100]
MDAETAEARLLDAAETLFNERGVQAVGMDAIRSASGVSLKRLYQVFPSKDDLLEAVLRRRDADVRSGIERATATRETPRERVLAVFDYLEDWFGQSTFRGCAFINAFGEMGGVSQGVADVARANKRSLQDHFAQHVAAAGVPPERAPELAAQLAVLANGAMATAGITGSVAPARQARAAATVLLDAAA